MGWLAFFIALIVFKTGLIGAILIGAFVGMMFND